MAHDTRQLLRSAMEDLNQALRSVLGQEASRPQLVAELLLGDSRPRSARTSAPRRVRSARSRPRRSRAARSHLALVP